VATATTTPDERWDFFIAHASLDAPVASRIEALLKAGGARVFLDAKQLRAGDTWPRVLAKAQSNSAVPVILVSKSTAGAYYALEEIATAIDLSRQTNHGHRVAPVYLEKVESLPYGLRVAHGLWALNDADLERAAKELLRLLPRIGDPTVDKVRSPLIPANGRFFTRRDDLLGRLAARRSGGSEVLTQTIGGMGGVGKTTLAAAMCWEQADVVDIVWWLRADSETTLIADLAELGDNLSQGGTRAEDSEPSISAVRTCRALERETRSWLIVFDNANSFNLVHRFSPRLGNGRVLVTTRRRDFGQLGPELDVAVFDPITAEAFLRARVNDTNPAAAREQAAADVARRLGGLPLALDQAGAFVAYSPLRSFGRYLTLLDDAGFDPFANGQPLDYAATATTTWQISIDAAGRRVPLAPRVMAAFGYLAAATIPLPFFIDTADHPFLASTAGEVTAAIEELYVYSLVSIDGSSLGVHRVVRDAVRRSGDPAAADFVIDALCRLHPQAVELPSKWAVCAELLAHVQSIAAAAHTVDSDHAMKISRLLDRAGTALRYAGAAAKGIPLLEQATDLDTVLRGPEHEITLGSRNDLAEAYWAAGRTVEASAIFESNLADRERLLGPDHRDTLESRNNVAATYWYAGRVSEAITLYEANLADRERVLVVDDADILASRSNLASAYWAAGRFADAIALYESNLEDRERVLGKDDPRSLDSREYLASAYLGLKRFAEAMTLFDTNLRDRERVLGPDHPDTFRSRNNLASAYRTAGRYPQAVTLFEANLGDLERVMGAEHPETVRTRVELAATRRLAGPALQGDPHKPIQEGETGTA